MQTENRNHSSAFQLVSSFAHGREINLTKFHLPEGMDTAYLALDQALTEFDWNSCPGIAQVCCLVALDIYLTGDPESDS